jgi:hypothetical protein
LEPGEPLPCGVTSCCTEWYAFQPTTPGPVEFNTIGSTCDTVLAVYIGPGDDFATLTNLYCNDDDGTNLTSKVEFQGTEGTIYWIQVGKKGGAGTKIQANMLWVPNLYANDSGAMTSLTNVIEIAEAAAPKPCNITCTYVYWYRFEVKAPGTLTVDTVGSSFNTVLGLYSSLTTNLVYTYLTSLGCNDDFAGGTKSRVIVPVAANTTVWAQVGGKNTARGTCKVNFSLQP